MKTIPGPVDSVVVVGAGLSGLAAALYLTGAGKRVTVLERDDTVGGRVGTYPVYDDSGNPLYTIDNGASVSHTVIEVNGRDRNGLLYDLTRALATLKVQISSAKVSTFGERAIDVDALLRSSPSPIRTRRCGPGFSRK